MVPGREVNGYLTFTLTQQPWDPRGSTLPLKGQVSGPHPSTDLLSEVRSPGFYGSFVKFLSATIGTLHQRIQCPTVLSPLVHAMQRI